MIRISVKTKVKPEEVIGRAKKYFSEELGLKLTDVNPCCAYFEGAGGHVKVSLSVNDNTEVEVESREWEHQAKEFLKNL